jgi:dihydrofolate reductase
MTAVIANLSMSLDGFIADPDDGVQELFGWYANGPVTVEDFAGRRSQMTETSAALFREALANAGAFLVGRRLYDHTNGWGGRPPADAPMVVVTHHPPDDWPRDGVPITFAADGIQRAVAEARALAGDRNVAVAGAQLARECLDAGLLDEIVINLVPVVLGDGIPFLAGIPTAPVRLVDPEVTAAAGVTHLRSRVTRSRVTLRSGGVRIVGDRIVGEVGVLARV